MVVTLGQQCNVGERYCTLTLIAIPGHQTQQKQKILLQCIIKKIVIVYDIHTIYSHIYSKSMDQPGKVASPARGQLDRKNEYFPVRVRA